MLRVPPGFRKHDRSRLAFWSGEPMKTQNQITKSWSRFRFCIFIGSPVIFAFVARAVLWLPIRNREYEPRSCLRFGVLKFPCCGVFILALRVSCQLFPAVLLGTRTSSGTTIIHHEFTKTFTTRPLAVEFASVINTRPNSKVSFFKTWRRAGANCRSS